MKIGDGGESSTATATAAAAFDASDQDSDRFIRTIFERSNSINSKSSSESGDGVNNSGGSEYAILNETLYNLVVQQLSEKDSVLLKAIRLIHQQKTNANRTGPYGYLPVISGTPYDHFGQKASPYGELALILLVIILWITSIMLCLNKYKKLRSLEPMIPAYNSGPSHIEDIKIVQNADEAVIYKKVRSSYLNLDSQPKINYILATEATPDSFHHHHSSPNGSSFFRSTQAANATATNTTTPVLVTSRSMMMRRSSSLPYCHRLTEMNKLYKSIQTNYSSTSTRPTPPPSTQSHHHPPPPTTMLMTRQVLMRGNGGGGGGGVGDVYSKIHVRNLYRDNHTWTVTNASHELSGQTRRKVPTSLNFNNYRRNFVTSLGGGSGGAGGSSFNTTNSQNNSSSSSNNFQMIKNFSSNYKRVLDRRHLYARSKYFVKRINVERGDETTNATATATTTAAPQTPTNRSVSLNKRSQDSTRSSSKDKEHLEMVNMAAAIAAAANNNNSSQGSSGGGANNTFDRGSGSFDTKIISEMDFSRKSSGMATTPAAGGGMMTMMHPKSPDLLDPNWIPQRVKSNLISLHKNIRRNRTDSAGSTTSSLRGGRGGDNNATSRPTSPGGGVSSSSVNPTMSKSDTNLKFLFGGVGRRREKRNKKQQLSLQEYQERKSNV